MSDDKFAGICNIVSSINSSLPNSFKEFNKEDRDKLFGLFSDFESNFSDYLSKKNRTNLSNASVSLDNFQKEFMKINGAKYSEITVNIDEWFDKMREIQNTSVDSFD